MDNNIVLSTKLVGEIKGEFYVPSYQRGYRWTKDEVTRLLDDIYQNGKKNYCLHPVVVRKKDNAYELVDGQQRLTTIYLIYKYMQNVNSFFGDPSFSLSYQTREKSADFLKNLDMTKQNDNIDFWFISNAYTTIQKWFEQDMQIRAMHIFEYLKEDVKIIWYEVGENEDAISLFTRLNIGKIPLTSAELIKAMFLSRDNSGYMSREKQEEISLQWDNIEKELHNDSLWYFLTNRSGDKYQTRIDLILDLIAGKQENSREKYDTFFKFEEMRTTDSLEYIWRKIQRTFLTLKDWFENHELYHKIGYLIASNTLTLQKIYELSNNKTKTAFKGLLNDYIRKSVSISCNYSELSYEKPSEYKRIGTLLLLFNVESVRKNGEHTQWFPFDKFKYEKGGMISWSLEHIHAQHSEGMKTQEVWREWLTLHIPSVKVVGGEKQKDLIQEMQNAVEKVRLERTEFETIQQKVLELLSVSGNTEYMHSISNLALLNTADNAALSNSTFDVKRNAIVEMDKKGQYIPFCTKMAFLKYYTPSEENQLHFWGHADRVAYVNAINEVLADYLDEAIVLVKEAL
ncbi:MAG: DUF262 domain-containing protein [Lachnospiraceae bacterium]|nr:DUF262 domain-containing protein [Lachnospiraceae bacterium]